MQIKTTENLLEVKPEYQRTAKKIFDKIKVKEKPETTIEPSFFSKMCDFFASLDPFSSCRGN